MKCRENTSLDNYWTFNELIETLVYLFSLRFTQLLSFQNVYFVDVASVRWQLKSLRQCQSLDEVYRLADSGEHERVVDLLLPLFDDNKLFDISATSDRYARSLLLIESFLSLKNFEVLLNFSLIHIHSESGVAFDPLCLQNI